LSLPQAACDSCYPDSKVADEMAAGFPLWLVTHVGCFSIQAETTGLAHGHAGEMSASFAAHSIGATKASGDKEMDRLLWEATMDEVKAGFLSGPYSVQELPRVPWPRRGLGFCKNRSSGRLTISRLPINSATGLKDKLQVDSIDEMCAMIKAWAQRVQEHPDWWDAPTTSGRPSVR